MAFHDPYWREWDEERLRAGGERTRSVVVEIEGPAVNESLV